VAIVTARQRHWAGHCPAFRGHGAAVRIADIGPQQAEATAEQITMPAARRASTPAMSRTSGRCGKHSTMFAKERIHILVNNAGISHIGTVETTSEDDFDRLFASM